MNQKEFLLRLAFLDVVRDVPGSDLYYVNKQRTIYMFINENEVFVSYVYDKNKFTGYAQMTYKQILDLVVKHNGPKKL